MINRTKVKESTQIKPGDNGNVLVMKDNAPEWSTPSDADLAKVSETDAKLAEKQDKLTAGDNIKIEDNVISADGKPTPINIGTVISGEVPMVSNSGTDTDVVLNFVLPKGDKGDPGQDGTQINIIAPLIAETTPTAMQSCLAIGSGAVANGAEPSIAIGEGANASGADAVVIGAYSSGGGRAIVIGSNTDATSGTVAIGQNVHTTGSSSVALGDSSSDDGERDVVSVGLALSGTEYGRRIIHVTDPVNAHDAATKNYVDTQLEPVNAKLQYVPENTNQILSQIQTNVEKAQSAADAKVASIAAGTGISVNSDNPTTPVISTTGLATQASVDALTATVTQLQQTVTQLQTTINSLTLETERI